MYAARTVKTCTAARLSTAAGTVAVRVRLRFDARDPYAVELSVTQRHARPTRWVFARDLLALGVSNTVGKGDVIVSPAADPRSPEMLIALMRDRACAVIRVSRIEIGEFVGRTYKAVPAGEESNHLDVETLLAQVLAA